MANPILQEASIVIPATWLLTLLGTETEDVDDILEHTSIEFSTEFIQEKTFQVTATEVVTVGIPGSLWAWVELSPYLSTTSAEYWEAIGGGGGAIAPFSPTVIVPTGVPNTVHTFALHWTVHSKYARLVLQAPTALTPTTDYWTVQAMVSAKGT